MPIAKLVTPPSRPTPPVMWESIELSLGTELPWDYKELVNTFGPGMFDDFVIVLGPGGNEAADLLPNVRNQLSILEYLKQRCDESEVPYPLFPSEPGLLPWATTLNGDGIYWYRNGLPEAWPVVVNAGREPEWEEFHCSAMDFLSGILGRQLRSRIFPESFPPKQHTFTPLRVISV